MRRTVVAVVLGALTGCAIITIPETSRSVPERDSQQTVGVGDTIYRYDYTPELVRDGFANTTTNRSGRLAFAQELVYSGVSNGRLRLFYREYQGNNSFATTVRQAFQQDADYDYVPGSRITFKGTKVDVLSADNRQIVYVVRSGFNNELVTK